MKRLNFLKIENNSTISVTVMSFNERAIHVEDYNG